MAGSGAELGASPGLLGGSDEAIDTWELCVWVEGYNAFIA
jgi:hypothetical protein